jgi:1-phosphatidylinositol-4-phosphate 5-kinase
MDHVSPEQFIDSLGSYENRQQIFLAGKGSGKSGSFFFFSRDKKLVIKTLQGGEKHKLLSIADKLLSHFEENPSSLIARIYGIYTLKTDEFNDIDLIVMQSTAVLFNPKKKLMQFDMKGSTLARYVNTKNRTLSKLTLKDNNFLEIQKNFGKSRIRLSVE